MAEITIEVVRRERVATVQRGAAEPDQAADFLLQRLLQGGAASRVESTTARSVMNALRSLRNRWANASGTLSGAAETGFSGFGGGAPPGSCGAS